MAAQCRSPRCTAERKGFRRELDSWRHRLIHCVGFESILEGLYGPGLRRDLSLFDDCEPEELVDWCVDEKCSLCSLRKETVDSTPSGGSAQSTPTEEVISQGQFITEKTECQAENYLNALFQKKDLPQNCDPNIPLVAQELMKKMIRQFAIEYVSKSRKMHQDNGTLPDSPVGCNGILLNQSESLFQEEQNSPLDLTVSRLQEHSFQDDDGALDLSLKRDGSGIEENSKINNLKFGVISGYFLRKVKTATNIRQGNTTLDKVLASFCLYHQQQLARMLRFLKEEQKICSQTCNGHLQNHKPELSKRSKKSTATFFGCAKEKLSRRMNLNKQASNAKLPYLSVHLQDLRLTWPNLTLGTVKLNPIKDEDLHLSTSDRVLHCINTRSKKKKFFFNYSNGYRTVSCSSFPRLKLQRVIMPLDREVVECDFKYCIKPASPSVKNQSCQTTVRPIKTVNENSNLKNSLYDLGKKQNNLQPTENIATTQESSQDKLKLGSVHFKNVFKYLLNNTKANHFAEMLNQDVSDLNTGVQTRFRKSKEKLLIFDGALSNCQSYESSSKCNKICDPFPKENITSGNNLQKIAETTASKKKHVNDVKTESTEKGAAWENKTELPHYKLSLRSKNVSFLKMSRPCLPECSTFLTKDNVANRLKKRSRSDAYIENGIPFKRYSKNILGKCKLCDVSHRQCSVPRNRNLFCKCTIKHNSGILMNFKPLGLLSRNTTDKVRKAHLKVVVKRLEDTFWLGTKTLDKRENKMNRNCNTRKTMVNQGKLQVLPSVWPKCTVDIAGPGSPLSSRSTTQKNQTDSIICSKSVTTCDVSKKPYYFSPIKLMFVSKVKTEDGVKYALSSVCTQSEKNGDQKPLSSVSKPSNHEQKDPAFYCASKCDTSKNVCASEAATNTLNQRKDHLSNPNNISHRVLRNIRRSIINNTSSKKNEMPAKNDLKTYIPNYVTCPQFSDNFRKSSTTETYVAKNISSTQIKIKKLPESPVVSDLINVGCSGDHTFPQRDACKVSLRFSTSLQTLGNPPNSYGLCVTKDCHPMHILQRKKEKPLSNIPQELVGENDLLESYESEQNWNQKTKLEKVKIPKSRLIRKKTVSDYFTRSRKSSLVALCFDTQPKSSARCALLQKSRKLQFKKSKHYRRKLRSYVEQAKSPLLSTCCADNRDQSQSSSTDCDLLPYPVEWWSTATSTETLLSHLESRYEHIAKTWVTENNVQRYDETQSLTTLKFSSSKMRSPIQMLFKKKCDMNNLATWLMQTTETQSLSIVRRVNACTPFQRNKKRSTKRTKRRRVNSSSTKNHLECRHPKESDVPEELHRVSKFVNAESFSSKLRKHKRKNNLNLNSLRSKDENVCVKRTRSGKFSNVNEVCKVKVSNDAKDTVWSAKKDVKNSTTYRPVQDSTLVTDSASNLCKPQVEALRDDKQKPKNAQAALYYSNKSAKNCFFVKKLGETSLLCSHETSARGNSMHTRKSCLRFNSYSSKSSANTTKPFATSHCLTANSLESKKPRSEMGLRKLRRTVVWYNGHCSASIAEKRKKHSTTVAFLEAHKKSPKNLQPITGQMQSDYPKLQIGPVKPFGFPATRALSSKYGSYSLTPIRIT